jgi:transaldolase/transaldolase/glucose-6-phosphate isomerase
MQTQNPLVTLEHLGQSIWLDLLGRTLIRSGQLKRLIEDDGLSGVTSNPTIFQKDIGESGAYDEDIHQLSEAGKSPAAIYEALTIGDIQEAADVLEIVHARTGGADGYVSLEVSPRLARDTGKTIEEAKRLWYAVNRPNVMIKIPGTIEGLPAIKACIAEGININITLLFGLPRYREVVDAYLSGLEDRVRRGGDLSRISSVASFFLSRIDVLIDPKLPEGSELHGQVAIASAKLAYEIYEELFDSGRFRELERKGARRQRLLWASTSTKNKEDSDVKYVEALIGPETVNTMPMETLDAYRDHGNPSRRLDTHVGAAHSVMQELAAAGIDIADATQELEAEGIGKFVKSFNGLLQAVERKAHAPVGA